MLVLQLFVDGLGKGAIYAALALAIVMCHRSTGLINFAQGEFATLSAMFTAVLTMAGIPVWISLGIAIVVSFLGAAAIQWLIVRPTMTKAHVVQVMITVGLFIVANAIGQVTFGPTPRPLASLFPAGGINLGGLRISWDLIGVIALQAAVIVALTLFFNGTKAGLGFRAVATAPSQSRIVGIRVERMHMAGWGIAGAIGCVAGVSLTNLGVYVEPAMMAPVLVFSLAAVTIGGFDSALGAIVGGMVMGVFETLVTSLVPGLTGEVGMVVSLVVIVVVLLIKPEGLFGRKRAVRV